MNHIKVEGHQGLVRDTTTGAILNVNKNEINAARQRKLKAKMHQEEVETLKLEVSEIKNILGQILEKLDGNNNI